MELLESPNNTFHEGDVESFVIVVEVNPARLAGDIFLPFLRVSKDGLLGCLVKGSDSHLFDLAFIRNT